MQFTITWSTKWYLPPASWIGYSRNRCGSGRYRIGFNKLEYSEPERSWHFMGIKLIRKPNGVIKYG